MLASEIIKWDYQVGLSGLGCVGVYGEKSPAEILEISRQQEKFWKKVSIEKNVLERY